jgi:outer membrane biosynthesis protein TonB
MLMRLRPAYDDDDDGFVFTRLRTKKAKAKSPDAAPEPETTAGASATAPEVQPAQQLPPPTDEHASIEATQPPRKKPRKTLPASPEPTQRRRSKRLSGNSPVHDQAPATSKPATESQSQQRNPATPPPAPTNDENVAPAADGSPALDQGELTIHKKRGPAKIPLPFGETPVLRRNKEMRKLSAEKSRRSSSGMRGRRASSLIEAGNSRGTWIFFLSRVYAQSFVSCFPRLLVLGWFHPLTLCFCARVAAGYEFNIEALKSDDSDFNHADIDSRRHETSEHRENNEDHIRKTEEANRNPVDTAVPHDQVETNEFYKHISQDLVEPKRMRQLLLWCGHRALPEKSVGGQMDPAETAAMHAGMLIPEAASKRELTCVLQRESFRRSC